MATISTPASSAEATKAALLAFLDALVLAEPIQARLWQTAEITLTQVLVLRALRDGPHTLGRLGQANGLSPTSITRVVDRLERRGLVSRRRESDDRRLVKVYLEPAGERLIVAIKLIKGTNLHQAVQAMSGEERLQLTISLRRLVALARASAPAEVAGE